MSEVLRLLPLVLASACVFPADEPTGVELSWRFFEVNAIDGEEALRVRTCEGAGFDVMVFDIVQVRAEERSGNFEYPCDVGFQTPSQFRTEASDAFIELHPADYAITVDGVRTGGVQRLRELEVDVLSRGLTVEGLDLALATETWRLEIANTAECGEVSFALRYRDPAESLAEPDVDDEGMPIDILYREALAATSGLPLNGTTLACADVVAGVHEVDLLDQGAYRLEIVRDGMTCSLPVDIAPGAAYTVADLANLPCGG